MRERKRLRGGKNLKTFQLQIVVLFIKKTTPNIPNYVDIRYQLPAFGVDIDSVID